MKKIGLWIWAGVTMGLAGLWMAVVTARPTLQVAPAAKPTSYDANKTGDRELAYLLVKLVLRTRATIYTHYTRQQSAVPGVDVIYRRWLAKNAILPAAVADRVYADVVPGATHGRAWVKMVVEEPRNPHNVGDATALEMFREIRGGASSAERAAASAYYYAEPIKSTAVCLTCHGEPRGEPDPIFPQYRKEGWKAGEVVGAVVARVLPEALGTASDRSQSGEGR